MIPIYYAKKFFTVLIVFLLFSQSTKAQLTTSTTLTPTQLVLNVLLGNGIGATGISYTGVTRARGSFTGYASDIGLDSGVILSSGNIAGAIGPNNTSGIAFDNMRL